MNNRISDSELLFLIAQGNLDAKRLLDKRYYAYCKIATKKFMETHPDYGYAYEDFFNAAMLGYCRARNKFNYEVSDGFFPYFKIWAESEMKALVNEGNKFYLNENPKRFVSLDVTYNNPDDDIPLLETFGKADEHIDSGIKTNEILNLLSDPSIGLTERELLVCTELLAKKNSKEIRQLNGLSYSQYRHCINSIRLKIGHRISEIIK